MNNTINERLSSLLESGKHQKKSEFNQKSLALHLGVSESTLSGWLRLKRDIPNRYIVPICEYFDVTLQWLFSQAEILAESKAYDKVEAYTNEEKGLIEDYRKLDWEGQKAIVRVIDMELSRVERLKTKKKEEGTARQISS